MARYEDPSTMSDSQMIDPSVVSKGHLSFKLPNASGNKSLSGKGSESRDSQNSYVLRGGFKMPRIVSESSTSLPDLKLKKA